MASADECSQLLLSMQSGSGGTGTAPPVFTVRKRRVAPAAGGHKCSLLGEDDCRPPTYPAALAADGTAPPPCHRHCDHDCDQVHLVTSQLPVERAVAQQRRPATINDALPKELILRIFSHLDMVTLCRCSSVCKQWSVLALDGSNWTHVDLFAFQKDIKGTVVQNIGQRCGGFLRHLSLYGCENVNDAALHHFATRCCHIETLDLRKCSRLSDSTLHSLGAHCRRLLSLNVQGCSQVASAGLVSIGRTCGRLRELDISWCHRVDDVGLRAVANGCAHLRKFVAKGCTNISDAGVAHIAEHCAELKHVSLHACHQLSNASVLSLANGCRSLECFSAAAMVQLTDDAVVALARNCTSLRHLELTGCHQLTDVSLVNLGENCKMLQRIDCEDLVLITDVGVKQLAVNCDNLVQLSLSHCESITDAAVAELAQRRHSTLAILELDNCPGVTDHSLHVLSDVDSLRVLDLYDCAMVSRAAIQRFMERRAAVSVHAYFAPVPGADNAAADDGAANAADADHNANASNRRRRSFCPNACVIL